MKKVIVVVVLISGFLFSGCAVSGFGVNSDPMNLFRLKAENGKEKLKITMTMEDNKVANFEVISAKLIEIYKEWNTKNLIKE